MNDLPKRAVDSSGKQYGRLLASNIFEARGNQGTIYWLCRCSCGNKKFVSGIRLRDGSAQSCGCLNIDHMRKVAKLNKLEYSMASKKRLFRRYRADAKKRKLKFNLLFKQFLDITSQKCIYCDLPPKSVQKADGNNGDYIYNGIDRINSDIGYTVKNCQTSCHSCNFMKGKMSSENFIKKVKEIYEHYK